VYIPSYASLGVYPGGYNSLLCLPGGYPGGYIPPYYAWWVFRVYIPPYYTSLGTPLGYTPAAVHLPGTPWRTGTGANPSSCRTDSWWRASYRHPLPTPVSLLAERRGIMRRREPPYRPVWEKREHAAQSGVPLIYPFHCWAMLRMFTFLSPFGLSMGLFPRVETLPTFTRFTVRDGKSGNNLRSGISGFRPVLRAKREYSWAKSV